jgi:D-arabinose 1-dehydrogenase-like Zn-dependent alcohol dehydrogenase
MRAVVYDKYGAPDVLQLQEVERPVPRDDEVLVKIHATTVNRTDCGFRQAKPFIVRYFSGLLRPKRKILGSELAGEVEAVGAAVSQFEVGDHVFGVNAYVFGAHAEFICMREGAPLAHKPAGMTFEEAAAVCDGAILALTCLRKADLHKGRSILIYGASGSIGLQHPERESASGDIPDPHNPPCSCSFIVICTRAKSGVRPRSSARGSRREHGWGSGARTLAQAAAISRTPRTAADCR